MADRICPVCGSTAYHYNSKRMSMQCSRCGHFLDEDQEQERQMNYDRSFHDALQHIKLGNWDQSLSILNSLKNQYPSEKRVYQAMIMAATEEFSVTEVTNTSRKRMAEDAWDKLVRLKGITGPIRAYGQKAYEHHRQKLQRRRAVRGWIFVMNLILGLFWLVLIANSRPGWAFLTFCIIIYGWAKLCKMNPAQVRAEWKKLPQSFEIRYNPFEEYHKSQGERKL